ncbi:hypothetical protein M0R19_02940 [Candidatus Pacearchaeota archaeon]|jgi:hypothetical protein|nr:hypothetical protein [Candidatus Pacearchaeota archaeon]
MTEDMLDARFVKLFGKNRTERLSNGIKISLEVLAKKPFCIITDFNNKYELREFEDILNTFLGYNNKFKNKKYLRTANEELLNYTIQTIK